MENKLSVLLYGMRPLTAAPSVPRMFPVISVSQLLISRHAHVMLIAWLTALLGGVLFRRR